MRPQYTPESRAVHMAAADIRKLGDMLGEMRGAGFMEPIRKQRTRRVYEQIAASPLASKLMQEGYPVHFAHRVAKLEKG